MVTEQPNYEIDLNERMRVSVMKTVSQISIIQGKNIVVFFFGFLKT